MYWMDFIRIWWEDERMLQNTGIGLGKMGNPDILIFEDCWALLELLSESWPL